MHSEWVHQNPDASQPLRVPLNLECNTSEDEILRNVLTNSKTHDKWLSLSEAHDGAAILCGSGPSLKNSLREIDDLVSDGGKVFALNGAAKFLYANGIIPDYQVIMDAQPQTADLVGPAREHLFASQVNPDTLKRARNLTLWQATFGEKLPDEMEGFPERGNYCLIGSFITVGSTSLILVYAMGYRKIHCFGYDSSHKENDSHAFSQKMNKGDPCTLVRFRGKDYLASFTMAAQAKRFPGLAGTLKDLGCSIIVHGQGLLPDIYNADLTEQEKYEQIWSHEEYRQIAPGEYAVDKFLQVVKPPILASVIDFGCGTGRALRLLHEKNFTVTGVDFASNCLDKQNQLLKFMQADLSKPIPIKGEYGFCTDVMEHIPPEQITQVIENIMTCVSQAFFQISLMEDSCGILIGKRLHLSVHGFDWWKRKFEDLGYSVLWSEDLGNDGQYHISTT